MERQPGNFRNVDVVATKGAETIHVQVKTHSIYRWVFGGGVNEAICKGAPVFNRVGRHARCDFVILLSPALPPHVKRVGNDWRFFVMPVAAAEAAFRVNIDAFSIDLRRMARLGAPTEQSGILLDLVS